MLLFLFEIVVLVALIITGAVVLRLNNTYDYAYNFAKDNLPNFTITKEGFHMDIEEPLIYKNTEYFNSVVVFDNNTENKKYLDEANQKVWELTGEIADLEIENRDLSTMNEELEQRIHCFEEYE